MTIPQLAFVPPTDTLAFSLTEERQITNDTVRISVMIHALKAADTMEDDLRAEMQRAVRAFIDAPDWLLSQARRETQPTGNETIALTASVRVAERENHGLKERADKVSRAGLTLSSPIADSTIPNSLMQAAERDLRATLLRRAMEEATVLSAHCPSLVVHTIQFGGIAVDPAIPGVPLPSGKVVTRTAVAPSPQPVVRPGSAALDAGVASSNSTRVSMTAAVVLRRVGG